MKPLKFTKTITILSDHKNREVAKDGDLHVTWSFWYSNKHKNWNYVASTPQESDATTVMLCNATIFDESSFNSREQVVNYIDTLRPVWKEILDGWKV